MAARAVVRRIFQHAGRLMDDPRSGSKPPELRGSRCRRVFEPPCRLVYREDSDRDFILYVMRAERLLRPEVLRPLDDDET
jgi:plasmid stabilization system protein ParE